MDIFSEFIERMHYDPFDECAQFLAVRNLIFDLFEKGLTPQIFASLRLLHDCFTNLLLFSSSSCFLLTSLFLLQNYRFVWPFQGRQSTHKKVEILHPLFIYLFFILGQCLSLFHARSFANSFRYCTQIKEHRKNI